MIIYKNNGCKERKVRRMEKRKRLYNVNKIKKNEKYFRLNKLKINNYLIKINTKLIIYI